MSIFDVKPNVDLNDYSEQLIAVLDALYRSPDGQGLEYARSVIAAMRYDSCLFVSALFDKVAKELNPPKQRKPRADMPKKKGAK